MKNRNKKIALILFGVLLVGFVAPNFAHAGFMDRTLSDVVSYSVKFALYIFNFLFSILFGLAGSLVAFTLKLNLTVTNTSQNALIGVGWTITRDIANLGFVLAMIIIAFATIVRSDQYGYKKLLPRLIGAAILVNFSLAIAGVFIDFSHVLTTFFLSKVSDAGYLGITEKLADAFGAQRYLLGESDNPLPPNPADETGIGTKLSTAVVTSIAEIGFITAFTAIGAIVLFILAIMLLIRFIKLSFLMILAPITWLFWVIPGQGKLFSQWWDSFIKQVFFAPAVTFFIYLALASVSKLGQVNETSAFFKQGALQAILVAGSQMLVLVGILIGGMMAAEKMGIEGAKAGMDRIKGIGVAAKNYTSNRAQILGQRMAKSDTGKALASVGLRFGKGVRELGEKRPQTRLGKTAAVATIPFRAPVQAAFSGVGSAIESISAKTQQTAAKAEKAPVKPTSLGASMWAGISGGTKGAEGYQKSLEDDAKKTKEKAEKEAARVERINERVEASLKVEEEKKRKAAEERAAQEVADAAERSRKTRESLAEGVNEYTPVDKIRAEAAQNQPKIII